MARKGIFLGAARGLERATQNLMNIMATKYRIEKEQEKFKLDKKITDAQLKKLEMETSPERAELYRKQIQAEIDYNEAQTKYRLAEVNEMQKEAEKVQERAYTEVLADILGNVLPVEERFQQVPYISGVRTSGESAGEPIEVGIDTLYEPIALGKQIEAAGRRGYSFKVDKEGKVSMVYKAPDQAKKPSAKDVALQSGYQILNRADASIDDLNKAQKLALGIPLDTTKEDLDIDRKNQIINQAIYNQAESLARNALVQAGETQFTFSDEPVPADVVQSFMPAAQALLSGEDYSALIPDQFKPSKQKKTKTKEEIMDEWGLMK